MFFLFWNRMIKFFYSEKEWLNSVVKSIPPKNKQSTNMQRFNCN